MAEVRRRLWRCSSLQVLGQAGSLSGGSAGLSSSASPLPMLIPSCSLWDAAQSRVKWETCLPGTGTALCEGIPRCVMTPWPNRRHYTQRTSSRAAQQNHRNGRQAGNGPPPSSPLYRSRTAYYDILEVSGKATQSQIKTAYYKQSFRYHPDRNAGSEVAALQFGEVTEAYHVLGSVNLRKKYDQGILSLEDVRTAAKPTGKGDTPTRKGASGRRDAFNSATSSKAPTTPMFNFDEFYRAHYGEQLERERFLKARRQHMEKLKKEGNQKLNFYKISEISAVCLMLIAFGLLTSLK